LSTAVVKKPSNPSVPNDVTLGTHVFVVASKRPFS